MKNQGGSKEKLSPVQSETMANSTEKMIHEELDSLISEKHFTVVTNFGYFSQAETQLLSRYRVDSGSGFAFESFIGRIFSRLTGRFLVDFGPVLVHSNVLRCLGIYGQKTLTRIP